MLKLRHRSSWLCFDSLIKVLTVLVGKTTFIKHLLGREYPGAHIGPEPTTDRCNMQTLARMARRSRAHVHEHKFH